jgi:RNA polymerase sigma factor (sigma-70 family)
MNNSEAQNDKKSSSARTGRFATTHWTVVLTAGRPESSRYQQALETLCQTYWFPLYAYLRRQGHDAHQAEDYTQAFFAKLLEKHGLRLADPKRGKFRSFLLAALKHFLANELDRVRAQKRGGNLKVLSLSTQDAETQYALQPAHQLTPEKLFERYWALTVLDRTLTRLKAESVLADKQELFDRLKGYLTAEKGSVPYRDAAAELNMTEGAVKAAVHRLRVRYRQLLRNEIAQTVANEEQIDEEIRDLFTALAN